jgi:hypothetical protein
MERSGRGTDCWFSDTEKEEWGDGQIRKGLTNLEANVGK